MAVDRVLLLGLMGAGKSTVGRALADRLGWPYADNDDLVHDAAGAAKETLLERSGETALRASEAAALRLALHRPGPLVAGIAAGVVLDPGNTTLLGDAPPGTLVVWLRARHATLAARVDADPQDRPWLGGDTLTAVERLGADREPAYAEVADVVVDVDDLAPGAVAERLATLVAGT